MTGAGEYPFFSEDVQRYSHMLKNKLCLMTPARKHPFMLCPLRHAALSMNIRCMQSGMKIIKILLAFCSDVLSSGKRTVSYRRGELMWSDSNWQTLYFSNPQVQAMFKEGIAHYGLLGGSSTHIAVHPLSISCSSWLGSREDHNSSQQAKSVPGKRNCTLWGVYTVDEKEIKNNNKKKNHSWNLCLLNVGKNLGEKKETMVILYW